MRYDKSPRTKESCRVSIIICAPHSGRVIIALICQHGNFFSRLELLHHSYIALILRASALASSSVRVYSRRRCFSHFHSTSRASRFLLEFSLTRPTCLLVLPRAHSSDCVFGVRKLFLFICSLHYSAAPLLTQSARCDGAIRRNEGGKHRHRA